MDNTILKYFTELSDEQQSQFSRMGDLYRSMNENVNVVSRKDIDNIYPHHILHSLAIAKVHKFEEESTVMDLGCGGGFPGIPLAVLYPNVQFKMVDSVGKKINVVRAIALELGLSNVEVFHSRAEDLKFKVDYVVSRAVTDLEPFMGWAWGKIIGGGGHGVLYLKGGDINEELMRGIKSCKGVKKPHVFNISEFFSEEYFETKKVIYIPKQ